MHDYLSQCGYLIPDSALEIAPVSSCVYYFVRRLNEPVTEDIAISAQPLITALERAYRSHMSRRQHDAHELLQLVLETLDKEYTRLISRIDLKNNKIGLKFPFSGTVVDKIQCRQCLHISRKESAYSILTLSVPQQRSVKLIDLLKDLSTPEIIGDYGCVSCRVKAALQDSRPQAQELKRQLEACNIDDLPEELEYQLPRITTAIEKSQYLDKLPDILCIHLSRSIFSGAHASRNSCKVEFPPSMSLYDKAEGKKVKYTLSSMIRHSGTHQLGHYECSRKKNLDYWQQFRAPDLYQYKTSHEDGDQSSERAAESTAPSSPEPAAAPSSVVSDSKLPFPLEAQPSTGTDFQNVQVSNSGESVPAPRANRKQWWAISDDRTRETDMNSVASLQSGAYILFYERIAP